MVLAPRMLQSIEVLALPRADLDSWLAEEALGNEALLLGEGQGEDPWSQPLGTSAARAKASDDHRALLEAQPDGGASLPDIIEGEIAARRIPEPLAEWVRFLVGCLSDAGLLEPDDERLMELAEEAGLALAGTRAGNALLADAIAELQQCEPRGIGARSSVEALLLQLDPGDEDYALLCCLLEDFLVELSKNKRPSVASKLGLDLAELNRLLSVLERLDPRPAAGLVEVGAPVVHPDVMAHLEPDGSITVELARGALPSVSIDPEAESLMRAQERGSEVRTYLAGKIEKARSVAEAVAMRGTTLLRVAEAALRSQRRFMEEGPAALRPLAMKDVAQGLGLATSTVSRAVVGKSVQTPFGIVPLRSFFQSTSGGDSAIDAVRDAVGKLVAAEDPAAPLSDEALVAALKGRGLEVARRTVAKYRKELGIPSSYQRRRHDG